jgi:hypothetical protein
MAHNGSLFLATKGKCLQATLTWKPKSVILHKYRQPSARFKGNNLEYALSHLVLLVLVQVQTG